MLICWLNSSKAILENAGLELLRGKNLLGFNVMAQVESARSLRSQGSDDLLEARIATKRVPVRQQL